MDKVKFEEMRTQKFGIKENLETAESQSGNCYDCDNSCDNTCDQCDCWCDCDNV